MSIFEHKEFNNHEQVVFGCDEKTGLKAIIAVHNTKLGPALGGCRMWPYANSGEALTDVLRLSRGMTYKSAMVGLKLGGGKAVIIGDARKQKTPELMRAMGEFVESVGGRYITAEDSGTSVADMKLMAERTEHVSGIKEQVDAEGNVLTGDPSPSTALGTYLGLKAAVQFKLDRDLSGIKVAIQGLGSVGYRLACHLKAAGAELFVTDIHHDSLDKAERELGATVVKPGDIFGLDVDVFAPCALGAIINDETIGQLKARVIAGASNNQLAEVGHGEILRRQGVLYAPDYVINAGGIIDVYYQQVGGNPEQIRKHVEGIEGILMQVFERAEYEGLTTQAIADVMAEERIYGK